MNPFFVAILKIITLEALAGLILASYFFERDEPRRRRWFNLVFVLIAVAGVAGYFNFGSFRFEERFVNSWEHYHFFLGSKYLNEVSYDGLYEASLVAMDEIHPGTLDQIEIRDLKTFEMEPARDVLARSEAIKRRFTETRWQDFKGELFFFFAELWLPVDKVLQDHGNTGSPAWAAAARPFTAPFTANRRVLTAISFVDVVLLVVLFVTILRCFGLRAMCITLTITMLVPRAYEFLGGSILRLDWLFALGMAACFLAVRRHKTAGVFIAWAIASKPFCALFALALGAKILWDAWRERRIRRHHVELVVVAAVALVAIVLLSSLAFGGFEIWTEYIERILLNLEEKYYTDNHSFRDVFLQLAHDGPRALLDWTPEPVASSLPQVHIADHPVSFRIAQMILLGLFVLVIARHDDEVFAFALGAFWVYVVFVTNMYYWQMLALPVLAFCRGYRSDTRKFLFLLFSCLFLMVSYVFVHWEFGEAKHLQGYFGSYWLLMFCLLVFIVELSAYLEKRRRTPAATGAR